VHDPLSLVVVDDVGDDDQSDADRHHAQSGPQDFGLVVILPMKKIYFILYTQIENKEMPF
jgi:hypothetical protein